MASTKGRALAPLTNPALSESRNSVDSLNEVVFFALPTPLFLELSRAAAERQQSLAQFLAEAVSKALEGSKG